MARHATGTPRRWPPISSGPTSVWRQPCLSAALRGRQRAAQSFWRSRCGPRICAMLLRDTATLRLDLPPLRAVLAGSPDRPWFALLEFALLVEVPRGIADERDSADRTVTPTRNKTKMKGFVEISTHLIHMAPKPKSNQWTHLSPFYTRMHGEWLRYAKSTSQFHWHFLLSQRWSELPSESPMSSRHNS